MTKEEALDRSSDLELARKLEDRGFDFEAYAGIDPDDEKGKRFQEVKEKLTWEQWNYIFSQVEKEKAKDLTSWPKKYDRL